MPNQQNFLHVYFYIAMPYGIHVPLLKLHVTSVLGLLAIDLIYVARNVFVYAKDVH